MASTPLDMKSEELNYARFSKRLFAYNIDMTILMVPCVLVSFLIESNFVFFILCILIVCLYHAVFESSEYQATIGKKISKLKVVDNHGLPLEFPQAMIRIVLKFFSLILLFSGFIIIIFRKDRKGLHDIVSKTFVINVESDD